MSSIHRCRRSSTDRKSTRLNSSHSLHASLPIYLANPLNQWTPILTNNFDGSGHLNLSTNVINPSVPQEFYRSEEHTSELQSLPTRLSSDLPGQAAEPMDADIDQQL